MVVPTVSSSIRNCWGIECLSLWQPSSSRLDCLDDCNYLVYQLPPYSKVVHACDEELENMNGHLSNVTLRIPFYPHLMRSGSAVRVVAAWHILSGGCLCFVQGTFGFPAGF